MMTPILAAALLTPGEDPVQHHIQRNASLNGGCNHTGRMMKETNLVEQRHDAMRREALPFLVRHRFSAKFAPQKRDGVER